MQDYAKRTVAKPRRQPSHTRTNNLLLLLAILFASFACLHFIQQHLVPKLKQMPPSSAITPIKKTLSIPKTRTVQYKNPVKKTKIDSPSVSATDQPKFDFYQLLPKITVNVSSDADTNGTAVNFQSASKKSSHAYVLQIASLKKNTDAMQIQHVLKAAGYHAFTQSYQAPDHTTWYRVLVGPFDHLKIAQAMQAKLDAHQTEALLTTMSRA